MNAWFMSDLHLGVTGDRIRIMQRPYNWLDLLYDYCGVIQPEDLVVIVGDVCDQGKEEHLEQLNKIRGRKWLLRGNHDQAISNKTFEPYFERIFPEDHLVIADIPCDGADLRISMNHYPHMSSPSFFHVTGHTHGAWKFQQNMINIGIDANHFMPVNATCIPFFLKAICEYYDKDVWCWSHETNTEHWGRGKKGYYFDAEPQHHKIELR